MGVEALPTRTDLQLLSRVHFRDADGVARECFGNVVELGPRSMRLEAGRPLEPGCQVRVQVVFPGQRQYARPHVQLRYVVRKELDESSLHYDLELTVLEKESHERLCLYLQRGCSARMEGT